MAAGVTGAFQRRLFSLSGSTGSDSFSCFPVRLNSSPFTSSNVISPTSVPGTHPFSPPTSHTLSTVPSCITTMRSSAVS